MTPELALGTAQFGLNYGITNSSGKVEPSVVRNLLHYAQNNCIRFIDTAQAYGEAQTVLGENMPFPNNFRLISKFLPQLADQPFHSTSHFQWQSDFERSLSLLKLSKLECLLLHSVNDLRRSDSGYLFDWLLSLQQNGFIDRFGVSIYDSQDLEGLALKSLQVIQIPCSIYDQRLIHDGTISRLRRSGIALHARSLFLQGLIVTMPHLWPNNMSPNFRQHHELFSSWALKHSYTLLHLAVSWAKAQPWMEAAVFGVTNMNELRQLNESWNQSGPWGSFSSTEWAWPVDNDIDPRYWS